MTCDIVTPTGKTSFPEIRSVTLPTVDGVITVLPRHERLMSVLKSGPVVVRLKTEQEVYAISGGLADVSPEAIKLLVQTAEHADEIDIMRAKEAKAEAERLMAQAVDDVHFGDASALLERNIARINVAEQHQRRARTGRHHREEPPPSTY